MKLDITRDINLNRTDYWQFINLWGQFTQRVTHSLVSYIKLQYLRYNIQHERRALASLTAHELKDIGISREDAVRESQRDYRDVPATRCS